MTSPTDVLSDVQGCQRPRFSSYPQYLSSAGPEAIELAAQAGLYLDEWQQDTLEHSLGERPDGKWASPDVGLVVPRQNGKGSILVARELAGLFLIGEQVIIHSAHEQKTASEQFRRLLGYIDNVPEFKRRILRTPMGKGNEAIELRTGQRIFFATRTSGGGRGFSADCLMYDEAMFLPDSFVAAVSPTLAARSLTTPTGVQTWYVGSAVDQQSPGEHGTTFARVREQGLSGKNPSLAYFEWGIDFDDPSRVAPEILEDPQYWALANPGLNIRIAPEFLARQLRIMGPRGFAVEFLSVGDWPSTDDEASRVITVARWNELADRDSKIAGSGVVAFDVAPDRSTSSIAGAGRRGDGLVHIGIIDRDRGTSWLAKRLSELQTQLHPDAIVADASGAVAPLLPEIERAGVTVTLTSSKEFAQACGMLATAADDKTIRHPGTPELLTAIADATTKPLADGWKWNRRSGADISPLVAVSLALWGVETQKPAAKARVINPNDPIYDLTEDDLRRFGFLPEKEDG